MDKSSTEKNHIENIRENNGKFSRTTINYLQKMFFFVLMSLTTIGTFLFITRSKSWVQNLYQANPKFSFPSLFTLIVWVNILTTVLLYVKLKLEAFFKKFVGDYLDKRYVGDEEIKKKATAKQAINIVKFIYYFSVTVFGYFVLRKTDFFPREMGGAGKLENLFNKGYPESFFFDRPWGFDLHHFINLAYTIVDFICITFIYEKQGDFFAMFFHHYCTVSLEVVSYYTGYSNIGAIVMFLHNFSDTSLFFSRSLIYSKFDSLKKPLGVWLLPIFVYTRQFLLARCIYALFAWTNWDWHFIVHGIILLLCLMYILHLYWSAKLIKINIDAFTKNEINDEYKITKNKRNEEKNKIN